MHIENKNDTHTYIWMGAWQHFPPYTISVKKAPD